MGVGDGSDGARKSIAPTLQNCMRPQMPKHFQRKPRIALAPCYNSLSFAKLANPASETFSKIRRPVSINVLSAPMIAFAPAKFA